MVSVRRTPLTASSPLGKDKQPRVRLDPSSRRLVHTRPTYSSLAGAQRARAEHARQGHSSKQVGSLREYGALPLTTMHTMLLLEWS